MEELPPVVNQSSLAAIHGWNSAVSTMRRLLANLAVHDMTEQLGLVFIADTSSVAFYWEDVASL